jgi:hypothetical protein
MNAAKTPEQIARMFGCTVEQARKQIEQTATGLRADLEKCKSSKTGKLRGLSCDWYVNRLASFEAALQ